MRQGNASNRKDTLYYFVNMSAHPSSSFCPAFMC